MAGQVAPQLPGDLRQRLHLHHHRWPGGTRGRIEADVVIQGKGDGHGIG